MNLKFHGILSVILILFLTSCAGKSGRYIELAKPQILATEQWQQCSHFPSVQLIDITVEGQVLIRDRDFSTPPVAFQHCMARVAYQQLKSGRRHAKTLIREAYFTHEAPALNTLTKSAGQFPRKTDHFTPGQMVTLFIAIEATDFPFDISLEWISPDGQIISRKNRIKISNDNYPITWTTSQIYLDGRSSGQWTVRIYIDGFHAGDHYFLVEQSTS